MPALAHSIIWFSLIRYLDLFCQIIDRIPLRLMPVYKVIDGLFFIKEKKPVIKISTNRSGLKESDNDLSLLNSEIPEVADKQSPQKPDPDQEAESNTEISVEEKERDDQLTTKESKDKQQSKTNTLVINPLIRRQKYSKAPDWIKYGFPPPEYLRFNFAGLNLSDHSVKVCKTVVDRDHYLVDLIDTISLPEGAVENGHVQDQEVVSKVLRKIKDTHNIDFVRLSVPEEMVYLATFTIPPTSADKLRAVVEFHIGDHIPLTIDEINFDFDPIAFDSHDRVTEVVAIAVAKTTAEEFIELVDSAGLIPLSLEVEAQALARVVTSQDDPKTYIVLDLGRSRTGISIIKQGIVRYTTTVSFGGDMLVSKIAEMRGISSEEAEKVKRTQGLDLESYSASERIEVANVIGKMVDEINRRENFWLNQSGDQIDGVLLVGGNASTPQLDKYLQKETSLPVRIPDIWQNVFSEKEKERPVSFNDSLGYAAVVGLAISEEK